MNCILMLFLLICMIFDIRSRKIPAVVIWMGIGVMGIYRIWGLWNGECNMADFICSVMPGVWLYFFSCISRQMGKGDGLLIIATGCFFTWKIHLGMLILAFTMAAVFSGVLIVWKRDFKNKKIPFVPFLFVASGIALCL